MLSSQERALIEVPRSGGVRANHDGNDVQLEPVPRLEWSLATESHPTPTEAATPASLRRSWIHTASENQVLGLYRKLNGAQRRLPAPWWLRALDRGDLSSRAEAFAIEDEAHTVLSSRPGWVFVPWADISEAGYWEYAPSDCGSVTMPTTVVLTDEHEGWLNVVPAYRDEEPLPIPTSTASLLSLLPQVESWRP
ncbi:hypothetical protein EIL87_22010 [Saccharopolyspora rhizosphaerae]|uniref:Uncharacterized protein n=1 Tax=Saccharopolyspora rhizosphaerae TaxID=2492662 RepID=A0A426JKQ6_9PSEU|nr:hypothetical protein [Saccharopolyspora rhizosphaerae]RRO13670.1 hypothetical protein EIL87_22010 [Saccharopolyspora rhizosphaerae]